MRCEVPQYEVTISGSRRDTTVVRARTEEEAVRSHLEVSPELTVELIRDASFDALSGWQTILINGDVAGRIRPFQRMRSCVETE